MPTNHLEVCTHTDGTHHDCRYVRRRNALIPEAEQLAKQRCRAARVDENGAGFNPFFFAAMDELAKGRGVVGGGFSLAAA